MLGQAEQQFYLDHIVLLHLKPVQTKSRIRRCIVCLTNGQRIESKNLRGFPLGALIKFEGAFSIAEAVRGNRDTFYLNQQHISYLEYQQDGNFTAIHTAVFGLEIVVKATLDDINRRLTKEGAIRE